MHIVEKDQLITLTSEIIFVMTWLLWKKNPVELYKNKLHKENQKIHLTSLTLSRHQSKYKQQLLSNSEPVYTAVLRWVHREQQNSLFIMRNKVFILSKK